MASSKITLKVMQGSIVPADEESKAYINAHFRAGDYMLVEVKRARNVRFHRYAHALGKLLAENIETFSGMDGHSVIKTIQREAEIECEITRVILPGFSEMKAITPRSIAFESMGQDAFHSLMRRICDFVSATYWPTMNPEAIDNLVLMMIE
ncbi:MAG: DUF1367 family protein [Desulfobulbaceae bacterium]|nr:DUF1367 family protein [Desulfobulbaceae bacterium]